MICFEKVIGYDCVKNVLAKALDQILNPDVYSAIGVTETEKGIMLYGPSGTGKTTLATEFLEKSGRRAFIIRKIKKQSDMSDYINEVFEKAAKEAPSIILLDDIDGWSNSDEGHQNTEEYRLVQSLIDEAKDIDIIFIATCNNINLLPDSLLRHGRFGICLSMDSPSPTDAQAIVRYYLGRKKLSDDVDLEDIAKAVDYTSCAELEALVRQAGINAGYARKTAISKEDIISAILADHYADENENEYCTENISEDCLRPIARHEAGHVLVAELLKPQCVGIANIRGKDGFIHLCSKEEGRDFHLCVSLSGKAAAELYQSEPQDGCGYDLAKAVRAIRRSMNEGLYGFSMLDTENRRSETSESMNCRHEQLLCDELERIYCKVKEMLLKHKGLLDELTEELMKKKTLLFSDIQKIIKSEVTA